MGNDDDWLTYLFLMQVKPNQGFFLPAVLPIHPSARCYPAVFTMFVLALHCSTSPFLRPEIYYGRT